MEPVANQMRVGVHFAASLLIVNRCVSLGNFTMLAAGSDQTLVVRVLARRVENTYHRPTAQIK